jgi:GNAT superfamily N-acetyltransferase
MMEYNARIATERDKDEIKKLCARVMGDDDYVIRILDRTIPAGGLFLAFDGERMVGLSNFQKCFDGSAWLSMARTDPDYRGRRVAGFLQKTMTAHARKIGVNKLRFLINSSNTPSLRAAARGGFKAIFETAHLSCEIKNSHKKKEAELSHASSLSLSWSSNARQIPSTATNSEIKSILSSSKYVFGVKMHFGFGWHFEHATLHSMRAVAETGRIYASGDRNSVFIFGGAEKWDGGQHGEFFILKGRLGKTLEAAKQFGARSGLSTVGAFLPYNRYFINTATRDHEFKVDSWADHGIVFERSIN